MASLLAYGVTLRGTYVYDDVAVVGNDPRVRNVADWSKIFTQDYFNGGVDNLYRPIVTFSYALQWWLPGNRAVAFHLVNILLNAAVAALVAEMTRRLALFSWDTKKTPEAHRSLRSASVPAGDPFRVAVKRNANVAALIAGLLFAVHPIHVEAVANIVGRAELASALCVVGAIVLLLRSTWPLSQFAALAVAVAGLFCKEQSVLQPLFWLIGWMILSRDQRYNRWFLLCTCWIWAAYLAVREYFFKFDWDRSFLDYSVQPMILSNGLDRVLMPVVLIGHYARLLIWPTHLSPDYGGDVIGSVVHFADPYFWTGLVAIAFWIAAIAGAIKIKNRPVVYCLLCFAAVYGMTGNILMLIGTNMSERLMYLPTAFLFPAIGIALARLQKTARWLIFPPLLLAMSWQTFAYARQWNHPSELFATALETHPGSVQLYLLLAQEYRTAGRYADAEIVLAAACDRHPFYYRVWIGRAENAMDMHDWSAAHRWIDTALKADGNHQQIAGAMDDLQKREPK